jgi:hypothetical protein
MIHLRFHRQLLAVSIIPLMAVTGCAPLKFYPGKERPDSYVSRLLFNSSGAKLSEVTIDGVSHPDPGRTVELLPGPHTVAVKYLENFGAADPSAGTPGSPDGKSAATAVTKTGVCEVKFSIEPTQELFLYVDAGVHPELGSSVPPTITLKEEGFEKPALYQERCKDESKVPLAKRAS